MNDLSQLMNDIKNEITSVVERHLLPHFERMKCNNENIKLIETVLKQMPEFQRLEKENAELKRELGENVNRPRETPQAPVPEVQAAPPAAAPLPEPEQKLFEHIIKLNIIETTVKNETVSESELYKNVNLSDNLNNAKVEEPEEEEEVEASEAEEEAEVEEEEVEKEDGVEGAEPLEEAEAEEEEEEEEEEEDGVEGAEPLEEEEASEAEEEEAEEEEEEEEEEASEAEEDGVEGAEPLEEEEASEAEEDGVEGAEPLEEEEAEEEVEEEEEIPIAEVPSPAVGVEGGDPLEEEVSIVSIKGHGKFYTSNPINGDIYKIEADEEVGDQVGKFVGGVPIFF